MSELRPVIYRETIGSDKQIKFLREFSVFYDGYEYVDAESKESDPPTIDDFQEDIIKYDRLEDEIVETLRDHSGDVVLMKKPTMEFKERPIYKGGLESFGCHLRVTANCELYQSYESGEKDKE